MNLREFFDRYGVPLGAIVALTLVIALLPGNASSRPGVVGTTGAAAGSDGANRNSGSAAGGAPGATGGAATGGAQGGAGLAGGAGGGAGDTGAGGGGDAQASGGVVFGQGPHCRADGRQAGVTTYMPPCADWQGTDNGGATWDGVTGDKVIVIRWLGQLDDATKAVLTQYKLADDDATVQRAYETLFQYSNQHYETYGREVVFVDYHATGKSENDAAMKADAASIADKHPFAVIEGNAAAAMPTVLARELSARGVLCLCTTSLTSAFYQENPTVISTGLPIADEYCASSAEYAGKRLAGRNAVYAGDELNPAQRFKTKPRVFGLIYINGAKGVVDPEGERIRQSCESAFAAYGISFAKEVSYLYDPGANQAQMTTMIAALKKAGVTTVVGFWDPLTPIFITQEATNQTYFPEWFVTGTGLSDTTTAGRLYSQPQWSHAFGQTPLWVTWEDKRSGAGWREYHHMRPQDDVDAGGVLLEVYRARIQTLFRGVHMAGPTLNQDTFRQGLWSFPPTPAGGGTAALPYVYSTPESPPDIKDFAEVYYDANASGNDERQESGTGMMMKTDGGRRYQIGQWPSDDPHVFQGNGIAVSSNPDGGGDPPHEQDGHTHPSEGCLSCT